MDSLLNRKSKVNTLIFTVKKRHWTVGVKRKRISEASSVGVEGNGVRNAARSNGNSSKVADGATSGSSGKEKKMKRRG